MATESELKILLNAKDNASKTIKGVQGTLGGFGKAIAGIAVAAGGLIAVKKAFDFIGESVKMAAEEQSGMIKLGMAIENTGQSYDEATDKIEDFLRAELKRTALDDGAGRSSIQALTEATGDYTEAMKLVPMAHDLAVATGMDLVSASKLIGKVSQGNTGILARYGIVMKKGATVAQVYAEIQKRFGGQAAAWAKSTEGQQAKLNIALANIKETVGGAFLPVLAQVAGGISDFITDNLPALEEFMGKVGGVIHNVTSTVSKLWDAFSRTPGDFGAKLTAAILEGANMIGGTDLVNKVANIIGVGRALSASLSQGDWAGAWGIVSEQIIAGFNSVWPKIQAAWEGTGGKGLSMEGVEFDFGTVGLEEKITEALSGISPQLGEAFADVTKWLETNIPKAIAEAAKWFNETLIPAFNATVKSINTDMIPALKDLGKEGLLYLSGEAEKLTAAFDRMNAGLSVLASAFDRIKISIGFSVGEGTRGAITGFAADVAAVITADGPLARLERFMNDIDRAARELATALDWLATMWGKLQKASVEGRAAIAGVPSLPMIPKPRARGGSDWVTKPTLFLAGERGPERVTVTPLGKGTGGNTVVIQPGAIVIQGNSAQGRALLAGLAAAGVKV